MHKVSIFTEKNKGIIKSTFVLVRVSIPAQHHDQEASWGGKGLFSIHFCIAIHHQRNRTGTQAGQEARADTEAMERCYLLGCFPWLAQPALL